MGRHDNLRLVPHGAPDPGRLVAEGASVRWEGPRSWRRQHGPATSVWVVGHLLEAEDVALADGSRAVSVSESDPSATDEWRLPARDGSWTLGTLAVSDADITFSEASSPRTRKAHQPGSLYSDVARSADAVAALSDLCLAGDLYAALCRTEWRKRGSGREFRGMGAKNARFVAGLRGRGECSVDFLMMGTEGTVSVGVQALLGGLGWEYASDIDRDAAQRRAENIVASCERGAPGATPAWYRTWGRGLMDGDNSLSGRMHRCAVSGRATLPQFEEFWDSLDAEAA